MQTFLVPTPVFNHLRAFHPSSCESRVRSNEITGFSPRIRHAGPMAAGTGIRLQLSATLAVTAALMVLIETPFFASLRPGYSHVANTISELGETGAARARQVAWAFFLPVGLLVWLALWLVHREVPGQKASFILAAMSCLGTGYVMAAVFPCDPGAPLWGSWRTQVHNVFGCLDYEGTGIAFLLVSRHFARRNATIPAVAFLLASALVFVGLVLIALPATFHIRGAVQRATEVLQFTGLFFICTFLPKPTIFKKSDAPAENENR